MKKLVLLVAFVVAVFCSKAQTTYTYEISPHGDGIYGLSWYEDVYGLGTLQYTQDITTIDFSYPKFVLECVGISATPNTTATAYVGTDDAGITVRIPISPVPTYSYLSSGSRSLNTAYQISSTSSSNVNFSVQISCTLSLTGGQAGTIILETSPNGSTGWNTWAQLPASNTGTLSIGINTTQVSGGMLGADLPAGYYWRLRTSNTTSTPTYTFLGGVQKLY